MKVGSKVILSRVREETHRGRRGTITKIFEGGSIAEVECDFMDGRRPIIPSHYRASIDNLDEVDGAPSSITTLSDLERAAGPEGTIKFSWTRKGGWVLAVRREDGTSWIGRIRDASGEQLEELFVRACRALDFG